MENYVNKLIEEDSLTDTIGTVVVDELHLAGDGSRGYLLEVMLSKILFLARQTQIIGLSATTALRTFFDFSFWGQIFIEFRTIRFGPK